MIIMEIDELLEYDNTCVKYIAIGDKVYAIALLHLFVHKNDYLIRYGNLTITQEHLDSMPAPERSIDHVDHAFLRDNPVVMFESVIHDERYMRFDGRHRIWAAHRLGLKEVPAMWCSREVWGRFIIGHKVSKDRPLGRLDDDTIPHWEYVPHSWDESPARVGFRRLEDDVHFEPNFELPALSSKLNPDQYHPLPAIGMI